MRESRWGPLTESVSGESVAIHWLAAQPGAVNLLFQGLLHSKNVEEALQVAQSAGLPPQNFVVGDRDGAIAWTIAGKIPRRKGFDGSAPVIWDGSRHWLGFLEPGHYPRVINPPEGQVWSANSRMVSGDALAILGRGKLAIGARQKQIRDRLRELDEAALADMFSVQRDNQALFLQRWQKLLLDTLDRDATSGNAVRRRVRRQVASWGGHADPESVGYFLVRAWRSKVSESIADTLSVACRYEAAGCRYDPFLFPSEAPIWQIVSTQPAHLLHPRYASWREYLLSGLDSVLKALGDEPSKIDQATWGAHNRMKMEHPLSQALPGLGTLLNLPRHSMPGDAYMPRVELPHGGASQRMGVSPGHETDGYLVMPAGQSGHPLSPFYRADHDDWVNDRMVPFLPGPPRHKLELLPPDTHAARTPLA